MGCAIFLGCIEQGLKSSGDVIELGVGGGGAGGQLCSLDVGEILREKYPSKKVYACDCFKGLPWDEGLLKKGDCFVVAADEFSRIIKSRELEDYVIPVVGLFADTLKQLEDKEFCLAWVDADLYESTLTAVKFLMNRMTKGGIIGFHDYTTSDCPGVKRVVDKYMLNNPDFERMESLEYPSAFIFFVRN